MKILIPVITNIIHLIYSIPKITYCFISNIIKHKLNFEFHFKNHTYTVLIHLVAT